MGPTLQKIMIFQTTIDGYREAFLAELTSRGIPISLFCGDVYFRESVRTRINFAYTKLENKYLFGRRALFQVGAITAAKEPGILILEMNPRIISNWMILLLSRKRNQQVFVWGHFLGRQNDSSQISFLRTVMCQIASGGVLAYTTFDHQLFSKKFPKKNIYTVSNSLYLKNDITPANSGQDAVDFAYCGRLDSDKQVEDVILAFYKARQVGIVNSNLHILGDGPLESRLRDVVEELEIEPFVFFYGHINEIDALKQIFEKCCAQVTNGFVGLNAIQSLGFGLPLIYPEKAQLRHAPEAYLLNSQNSLVTSGTVQGLSNAMIDFHQNRTAWRLRSADISSFVSETHSVEIMADGMIGMLHGA